MSVITRQTIVIGYPTIPPIRSDLVNQPKGVDAAVSSRSLTTFNGESTPHPILAQSPTITDFSETPPVVTRLIARPKEITPKKEERPTELQLFWKKMGFQPGDCIARQYSKNIVYWGQTLTGRGKRARNTHIAIFLEPTKDKIRILEALFDRVRVVEKELDQFKEYVEFGLDVISSGEAPCKRALTFLNNLARNIEKDPVYYNYLGFLYAPFVPSSSCTENAIVGMETLRQERLITFDGCRTRFAICSDVGVKVLTAFQIAQQAAKEGLKFVKLETIRSWQKEGKVLDRDSLLTTPAALVEALQCMPGQRLRKLDQTHIECAIDTIRPPITL